MKKRRLGAFWNALRSIELRPYDIVIVVLAVTITVAFSFFAVGRGGTAGSVEIKTDNGTFVYPLDEDRHIHAEGPLGTSEIIVEDGRVRFTASPCRDKICITAGDLSRTGEWAACLPNRVFVTITGESVEENPIDAMAF